MASKEGFEENAVHYTGGGTGQESVRVEMEKHSPVKTNYSDKSVNPLGGVSGYVLFERASGSWWNPKFDSEALEKEQIKSYFPQTKRRFQYALFYISLACVAWCLFFGLSRSGHWLHFLAGSIVILAIVAAVVGFSYTRFYNKFYLSSSVFISIILLVGMLLQFIHPQSDLSTVGTFCASIEVMLMLYTVIPMRLFMVVGMGVVYSILYEVFTIMHHEEMQKVPFIVGKILLHLCIHLIGIHIFIMAQIRRRSTFWKIGQSAMARQDLEIEKQIKEQMIHSLMPASVAQEVMKTRDDKSENKDKQDEENNMGMNDDGRVKKRNSKGKQVKGEIIFRSFTMNKMENVSILFADIVGFTKMSSNKTAEHLVGLLNDLFGRFDVLCAKSGCEKISTLGDCYYCVAGCPESRPDHAKCCVEMGLGMIKAIQQFDIDNKESVDMRVGVHTGTVLCGIVGTRRFKFDVWSNDVTLANTMESTGEPGTVHISEASYEFLKDLYEVKEGPICQDNRTHKVLIEHYDTETSKFAVRHKEDQKVMNTYFIIGRKGPAPEADQTPSPGATPEITEEVAAGVTEIQGDQPTESDSLVKDVHNKPEKEESDDMTNHCEKRPGANGVSPAALLGRRHSSGFYAASELSLDKIVDGKERENIDPSTIPINEAWKKYRALRETTDQQIIRCLKERIKDQEFFYRPPINRFTLRYNNNDLEENYRYHYLQDSSNVPNTISSPKYHALLETIVSFIVFTVLSTCCFMIFDRGTPWIILFIISLILEILILIHTITDIRCPERKMTLCSKFSNLISGWVFRNILGAVLASVPVAAVYSNASCEVFSDVFFHDRFFCYCIVVALLHFINFTMLSSWMKSVIAALAGIVLLVLLSVDICPSVDNTSNGIDSVSIANMTNANLTQYNITQPLDLIFSGEHIVRYEIILDMVLLLLLIFFLNREFEVSYRLSYHGDFQAAQDKQTMQQNKEQADWLLHNIIPQHVSDVVKKTSKYSKNHKDVGVIFACIVNFNEFYDESYKGGREYLRVLNELVSDYECLLDEFRFRDVEKIKTISSTFMAASGLNEVSRMENKHPYAHLFALMDFAIELQNVIERFNESIFNFSFILNIGYNFGEVTAGVIGTTKLLYDIWGDTVNISSRMYSTGIEGRIQVPQSAAELLKDFFEFEYRGVIAVKGKGDMHTYLLVKKKEVPSWE